MICEKSLKSRDMFMKYSFLGGLIGGVTNMVP